LTIVRDVVFWGLFVLAIAMMANSTFLPGIYESF
jgi:hypothetical protein